DASTSPQSTRVGCLSGPPRNSRVSGTVSWVPCVIRQRTCTSTLPLPEPPPLHRSGPRCTRLDLLLSSVPARAVTRGWTCSALSTWRHMTMVSSDTVAPRADNGETKHALNGGSGDGTHGNRGTAVLRKHRLRRSPDPRP